MLKFAIVSLATIGFVAIIATLIDASTRLYKSLREPPRPRRPKFRGLPLSQAEQVVEAYRLYGIDGLAFLEESATQQAPRSDADWIADFCAHIEKNGGPR